MVALQPIFKKAYYSLIALCGFYFFCLLLLTHPEIQRNAVYMHKLKLTWFRDLRLPTEFGFAASQVTPFYLPNAPHLFAWHVLPLGLYAKHRSELIASSPASAPASPSSGDSSDDLPSSGLALELLRSNPRARLIVHFHGNAGTLGAGARPAYLRSLSAADPENIHILAIDYRGYGLSSGVPSEDGLIEDGVAAVRWAMEEAGIPPERIALLGQSLGTAVTFGVAEKMQREHGVEFGAVISIAGFTSMRSVVTTYKVAGVIPILSPLRSYPWVQRWLAGFVNDEWNSALRIESLVRNSRKAKIVLIHAANDFEITARHSEKLFVAAVNGTAPEGVGAEAGKAEVQEFGEESRVVRWQDGERSIEHWTVKWGGHNLVVTAAGTSVIVADALGLVQ